MRKNTKALTQFPLVSCAQETVGGSDVLETKTQGSHLAMNLFALEGTWDTMGTSKHEQACPVQEKALHRETCLLGSALAETTQVSPDKPPETS